MAFLQRKKLTESGQVTSKACGLSNILVGKDGTNNITNFSLYEGTDNSGREVFPTIPKIDADSDGKRPFEGMWSLGEDKVDCNGGLYAEFTCSGSAEIFFYFIEKEV